MATILCPRCGTRDASSLSGEYCGGCGFTFTKSSEDEKNISDDFPKETPADRRHKHIRESITGGGS